MTRSRMDCGISSHQPLTHSDVESLGVVKLVREVDRLRYLVNAGLCLADDMSEQLAASEREHFAFKLAGLREHVRRVIHTAEEKLTEDRELEGIVLTFREAREVHRALEWVDDRDRIELHPEEGLGDEAFEVLENLRAFLA